MTPFYNHAGITIYHGDCIESMKSMEPGIVNTCVTSPPYWGLRDYGVEGQLGLESTPDEYVAKMVEVFREVRRVLRDDGTLWLNLGDSYTSGGRNGWGPQTGKQQTNKGSLHNERAPQPKDLKPKDLVGIPWRVAFPLQADGWYLRSDIIWHKPNVMPESVTDRPTKSHEYIFLLSKSQKYHYDHEAIKESTTCDRTRGPAEHPSDDTNGNAGLSRREPQDTKNKRSVWTVPTQPFKKAHFAVFPPDLIEPCILAGCPKGGTVLDPFLGSGTTAIVAKENYRNAIGCELNHDYIGMAIARLQQDMLSF